MKEITQNNYYHSIEKKYVDVYLSVKACLESFLSDLLFQGDVKRVFFSQPDIIFRRRMELLDNGRGKEEKLTPIHLNLPFASYYQSSDFEDDDRTASVQAGQSIEGQYILSLGQKLRSLPVKANFKIQIFFDRRDDVRVAHQLLHWERSPKSPVHYYDLRYYRGEPIAIPINFTIDSVTTTPDWKELDFLKQQKMFPIEVGLTVRTYQILINNINNFVDLPIRINKMYRTPELNPSDIVLTNETLLLWSAEKFDLDKDSKSDNDKEIDDLAKLYFNTDKPTKEQLEWIGGRVYNNQTLDIITAYFNDDDKSYFEYYCQDFVETSSKKATIRYSLNDEYIEDVAFIEFLVPAREPLRVSDLKQTKVVLDNLTPNSIYKCKIFVYTQTGERKLYNLEIKTRIKDNDDSNSQDTISNEIGETFIEGNPADTEIIKDTEGYARVNDEGIEQEPSIIKLPSLIGRNI
jgi:hypothetical protein